MNLLLQFFIIAIILIYMSKNHIQMPILNENFINKQTKKSLYDNPNECPFDRIIFDQYKLGIGDKFIVKSKLKDELDYEELSTVFGSVDEFKNLWDQTKNIFPNLGKCGDPYLNYLNRIKDKSFQLENIDYSLQTTLPLYENQENFIGNHPNPTVEVDNNILNPFKFDQITIPKTNNYQTLPIQQRPPKIINKENNLIVNSNIVDVNSFNRRIQWEPKINVEKQDAIYGVKNMDQSLQLNNTTNNNFEEKLSYPIPISLTINATKLPNQVIEPLNIGYSANLSQQNIPIQSISGYPANLSQQNIPIQSISNNFSHFSQQNTPIQSIPNFLDNLSQQNTRTQSIPNNSSNFSQQNTPIQSIPNFRDNLSQQNIPSQLISGFSANLSKKNIQAKSNQSYGVAISRSSNIIESSPHNSLNSPITSIIPSQTNKSKPATNTTRAPENRLTQPITNINRSQVNVFGAPQNVIIPHPVNVFRPPKNVIKEPITNINRFSGNGFGPLKNVNKVPINVFKPMENVIKRPLTNSISVNRFRSTKNVITEPLTNRDRPPINVIKQPLTNINKPPINVIRQPLTNINSINTFKPTQNVIRKTLTNINNHPIDIVKQPLTNINKSSVNLFTQPIINTNNPTVNVFTPSPSTKKIPLQSPIKPIIDQFQNWEENDEITNWRQNPYFEDQELIIDENIPQFIDTQFGIPNVPQFDGNEQIDTSVEISNFRLPPTYTEDQIQMMENNMIDDNFERQIEQQKIVMEMSGEIERLTREINLLRDEIMFEREHFENLNASIENKRDQINNVNDINQELVRKVEHLNRKNIELENLYLMTDSQKNTLEVRLNNIRDSIEEERVNSGYTYLPPTNWTLNQWRPPVCLPEKQCPVCPTLSNESTGNYLTVFNQSANSILPKFKYENFSNGKYYKPSIIDKRYESEIRKIRDNDQIRDMKTDFIDPIDYPTINEANPYNLPYSELIEREIISYETNGYRS